MFCLSEGPQNKLAHSEKALIYLFLKNFSEEYKNLFMGA